MKYALLISIFFSSVMLAHAIDVWPDPTWATNGQQVLADKLQDSFDYLYNRVTDLSTQIGKHHIQLMPLSAVLLRPHVEILIDPHTDLLILDDNYGFGAGMHGMIYKNDGVYHWVSSVYYANENSEIVINDAWQCEPLLDPAWSMWPRSRPCARVVNGALYMKNMTTYTIESGNVHSSCIGLPFDIQAGFQP